MQSVNYYCFCYLLRLLLAGLLNKLAGTTSVHSRQAVDTVQSGLSWPQPVNIHQFIHHQSFQGLHQAESQPVSLRGSLLGPHKLGLYRGIYQAITQGLQPSNLPLGPPPRTPSTPGQGRFYLFLAVSLSSVFPTRIYTGVSTRYIPWKAVVSKVSRGRTELVQSGLSGPTGVIIHP